MTLVACRMYNQTESLVPGRRVFFIPSRFVCENVESIEINRKQSETVSRQAQADNFHYPLQSRWNQGGGGMDRLPQLTQILAELEAKLVPTKVIREKSRGGRFLLNRN